MAQRKFVQVQLPEAEYQWAQQRAEDRGASLADVLRWGLQTIMDLDAYGEQGLKVSDDPTRPGAPVTVLSYAKLPMVGTHAQRDAHRNGRHGKSIKSGTLNGAVSASSA